MERLSPLIHTLRRFSSAAMPYGDIPARAAVKPEGVPPQAPQPPTRPRDAYTNSVSPDRNAPTTVILGTWFGILRMFGRSPNTPSQRPR